LIYNNKTNQNPIFAQLVISLNLVLARLRLGLKNSQVDEKWVNSNLIENTGASNETIYTSIDGDSVHTPLNGGATGGPGDLPSTTADAGIRTAPPEINLLCGF
jgi:hypothetical protein